MKDESSAPETPFSSFAQSTVAERRRGCDRTHLSTSLALQSTRGLYASWKRERGTSSHEVDRAENGHRTSNRGRFGARSACA